MKEPSTPTNTNPVINASFQRLFLTGIGLGLFGVLIVALSTDTQRLLQLLYLLAAIILTGVLVTSMSKDCLLYTSPSPRDLSTSRMPSSA